MERPPGDDAKQTPIAPLFLGGLGGLLILGGVSSVYVTQLGLGAHFYLDRQQVQAVYTLVFAAGALTLLPALFLRRRRGLVTILAGWSH